MKSLTSEVVSKITQFVNERSVESTDIIHKRNDDGNVVVSLTTDLQPMYCSPNGNRVLTDKGYKVTRVTFDSETGDTLSFEAYVNVGYGFEEFEFNGPHDIMPVYTNRVSTETFQAW